VKAVIDINSATYYKLVTITVNHECFGQTVTALTPSYGVSYTNLQTTISSTLALFSTPSTPSCFTYTLWEGASLLVIPSSYMTFTYPTLTLHSTTPSLTGTSPTLVKNLKVHALNIISGSTPVQVPLVVTLYHECYSF
jgi:hypothetical protein